MPDGRIEPGQDLRKAISARAWNRAQAAADVVLGSRPSFSADQSRTLLKPYTWCMAINDTTTNLIPRWGVMQINGLVITPNDQSGGPTAQFEQMPVLRTRSPQIKNKFWCIAVEPIARGAYGKVAIAGVVQCKLQVDDEKLGFARLGNSTDYLVADRSGEAAILWKESGTGSNKWALIRIGADVPVLLGKTFETWIKGTTQEIELWPDRIRSNPLETQEAVNVFADVEANRFVMLAYDSTGKWYLTAAEC